MLVLLLLHAGSIRQILLLQLIQRLLHYLPFNLLNLSLLNLGSNMAELKRVTRRLLLLPPPEAFFWESVAETTVIDSGLVSKDRCRRVQAPLLLLLPLLSRGRSIPARLSGLPASKGLRQRCWRCCS
jgi:hypothetical protein